MILDGLRACRWRALGFALPTVVLVVILHLAEQPTAGEAADGLISGLWFAAVFLLASALRQRLGMAAPTPGGTPPIWEFLLGSVTAVVAWSALWVFWSFAPSLIPGAQGAARLVNAAVVMAAALVAPVLPERPAHAPAK